MEDTRDSGRECESFSCVHTSNGAYDGLQLASYHTFSEGIPVQVLDALPNPASTSPTSQYLALISSDGLLIADMETLTLAAPISAQCTCGEL